MLNPKHINHTLKKICTVILLCISFVVAHAADAWKLEVSDNSRFLQYSDGRPFFWLGDTGWLLPSKLDRDEARTYLENCRKNGYNVVQVQVLNGVPSINAYGQYSNNKQSPWDFSCFSRDSQPTTYTYWDHLDYIVAEAERNGIYIAMTCIWGGLVKQGLLNADDARAYGRFLAERYKDRPNIIWLIGGDVTGDTKPEVWDALARTIKQYDCQHLMTFHPRGRTTSAKWWADVSWLDFHMYQSGHRKYGQRMGNKQYPIPDNTEEDCWMYVDSTWNNHIHKPVLDGEPSYEDIPKGLHFPDGERWKPADVRRYAYWDVFAGACGHTYGHNAIMQMHKPGHSVAYANTCKTWYEAQRDSGYIQMQYLKALMLSLPYFDRIPDQGIIYRDNGTRYERLSCTRGNDYILIYNYTGRSMHVDLDRISGSSKDIWWMDATTGNLTYMGRKSGRTMLLPPSGSHDGVLIAIDSTRSYIAKQQGNIMSPVGDGKDRDLTE